MNGLDPKFPIDRELEQYNNKIQELYDWFYEEVKSEYADEFEERKKAIEQAERAEKNICKNY